MLPPTHTYKCHTIDFNTPKARYVIFWGKTWAWQFSNEHFPIPSRDTDPETALLEQPGSASRCRGALSAWRESLPPRLADPPAPQRGEARGAGKVDLPATPNRLVCFRRLVGSRPKLGQSVLCGGDSPFSVFVVVGAHSWLCRRRS